MLLKQVRKLTYVAVVSLEKPSEMGEKKLNLIKTGPL